MRRQTANPTTHPPPRPQARHRDEMRRLLYRIAQRDGLNSQAITLLVSRAEIVESPAGTRIAPTCNSGSDLIPFLVRGVAREELRVPGAQDITIGFLGPGEFLCVPPSAPLGEPCRSEILLHEPSAVALVSQSAFVQAIACLPGVNLAQLTSWTWRRRTRALLRKLQLLNLPLQDRIEHELVNLARALGRPEARGVRIAATIPETALACLVAASRPSVSRCVAKLRKAGLLDRVDRGWVVSHRLMAGERLRDGHRPAARIASSDGLRPRWAGTGAWADGDIDDDGGTALPLLD